MSRRGIRSRWDNIYFSQSDNTIMPKTADGACHAYSLYFLFLVHTKGLPNTAKILATHGANYILHAQAWGDQQSYNKSLSSATPTKEEDSDTIATRTWLPHLKWCPPGTDIFGVPLKHTMSKVLDFVLSAVDGAPLYCIARCFMMSGGRGGQHSVAFYAEPGSTTVTVFDPNCGILRINGAASHYWQGKLGVSTTYVGFDKMLFIEWPS